ncbi:MAG: choice-of-anchor J domain-containing protein [Prevotella pectinovora]|uniref:choice-of-anchor J domain-containing protein n=1 Tax=Prevotella pectinovora TaxID=1602169 RepID=UPI002E75B129|nr:choice-of-anchor J domain-containing protein [Prevotella pectinovora]MEE1546249.1 choice-of-anchor J domain-containing protein [Prevotella pectinovora]
MKKTLLLFVSLLMTMGMFAQSKTAKFDFTGESAYGMTLLSGSTKEYNADPTVCTEGDVTLTLNGQTRWWKATNGNELRFYKGADMTFKVPEGNVITKVELTAKVPAKFESAVGTYANGTWTGSANSVVISTNITEKNTPISSAVVTYQSSSAPMKKDPALSFSETTASGVVGEAFVAPTLTKATTAAVVYTSSDEAVATVNAETGEVTLLAAGETKITATAAENDEYNGGSASYTLTVTTPALDVVKEPYSESFETGFGSFVLDNVNLSEGLSYVWAIDKSYKCAKASAYVNKKNLPSESWLVSPWIELSAAEVIRSLYFDHAVSKYFGNVSEEATLWIKVEGGDWTQITSIAYPEVPQDKSFSPFETQAVSLAGYEGKKIKVGFKYVSTDEAAGTWEIRNFKVSTDVSGINEIKADKLDVNAPVYNLAGQRVNANAKGILIQNGKKFIK